MNKKWSLTAADLPRGGLGPCSSVGQSHKWQPGWQFFSPFSFPVAILGSISWCWAPGKSPHTLSWLRFFPVASYLALDKLISLSLWTLPGTTADSQPASFPSPSTETHVQLQRKSVETAGWKFWFFTLQRISQECICFVHKRSISNPKWILVFPEVRRLIQGLPFGRDDVIVWALYLSVSKETQ